MPSEYQPDTADPVTLRWLGCAGVEIAWNGQSLLIDPYFSRLPLRRCVAGRPRPDLDRIAAAWNRLSAKPCALAVTHTHIDHALDIPELAKRSAARILGSESLHALLTRAGAAERVTICKPGDVHELPAFGRLSVFAGAHGNFLLGRPPFPGDIPNSGGYPLTAAEYRTGEVLMYDVTVHGRRFVHGGSAGLPQGAMPEGACDVLLLCVPGWQASKNYLPALLEKLQPRRIVPFHHDNMAAPLEDARAARFGPLAARWLDLEGFIRHLRCVAPDVPVHLPELWNPIPAARTGMKM